MRVAVDATPLLHSRTGVGHLAAGTIHGLAARSDVDVVAYAVTWSGRHDLAGVVPPRVHAATAPFPARLTRAAWKRLARPRIEHWTGPVDVVHGTNYVAPPAAAPVLVTVHDLTALRWPELCTPDVRRLPALLRAALRRGAYVHAISDHVADEIRDAFQLPAERVVRVYPGIDDVTEGDAARGRTLVGADKYVLALGTVEPRKNLPILVQAFDGLAARDADTKLVIAGPDGWGAVELRDALDAAKHAGRVLRLGYLDNTDRSDVLAGATVLAYPSRYEGFGLPPLEAMTAGVAVVAARAGAVPEATGDAAVLVDPGDVDALGDALVRVLDDDELRASMVARGRAQATRFTWPAAVDGLMNVYRRLAEIPGGSTG